ncbi:MAG: tetratricopeptide repeat protein [Bacteroidales bacterium]|nr:tetratricopeptide repeat protein [Bacteroidales bacterium]
MKKLLIILALVLPMWASAQNQEDVSLAYSYYNSREYEKAVYLFENLFNQTHAKNYFNYYIKCLESLGELDKAEKAVKKQMSANKNDLSYKITLGSVYKSQGKLDKAAEQFDGVLTALPRDRNSIIALCNSFLQADEPDYAEKTLQQGAEVAHTDFSMELFSVYASSRNYKKMSETSLDVVSADESRLATVENMLQYYLNNDTNDELYSVLRSSLMQSIQKSPSTALSEMLIWVYVQKKNFKMAVNQAKALDRRTNRQGRNLVSLGEQALDAGDYATAADAYKYVLELGEKSPYHYSARLGVLYTMYRQVVDGSITDTEQLEYLENEYRSVFAKQGLNSMTAQHIINFARLEAYYLNHSDTAKAIINQALQQPLSFNAKADLNLQLADIYLYTGDEWEALMIYAKVENDNKQNEKGDEAKLRKAKVAYYTGSFKWALSQLDVLKAATSKLVANDAMELAILINDNLAVTDDYIPADTTAENPDHELQIFARGDMYMFQCRMTDAFACFDTIVTQYKSSPLVDEALYRQAQIYERQKDYSEAASLYQKVADDYAYDNLADKAAFRLAEISSTYLADPETAKTYYLKILTDYPGSIYAVQAREKFRKIDGR